MSPQFFPVPTPTTGMIVAGVVALAILLFLSALLGAIGKKKWQSFEEYLVGRRDIGPLITGAALSASYISGWAFCGSTGIVYTAWILRDVVCRHLEPCGHHSLYLACCD